MRPRSSLESRARLCLLFPRRPHRRQASPPPHHPRPSGQRRSCPSHVSRARVSAVRKTRSCLLCLSPSKNPQAARSCCTQPLAQPRSRLRPSSIASALSTEPPTTVPMPTSSASQEDLHQFARPSSRESSESPRRTLQIAKPQARGDRSPTRQNRPTALPDVTSSAEPVIVLDDDDTLPEHVFEPFEREEGAWEEPAQDESARDTAAATTALSRSPSIPVPAPVTSVVTVHAPLLAVTSAPSAALPSRVTLATAAAISSSLVRAATTVVTAGASASRALTRSPSLKRSDSKSWVPYSPIHPLVWAPAPSASSLDTSPLAPRGSSSSTASHPFTSSVAQLTSPSADFARPPAVIIPAEAAVRL